MRLRPQYPERLAPPVAAHRQRGVKEEAAAELSIIDST